jgi:hypothetical protein
VYKYPCVYTRYLYIYYLYIHIYMYIHLSNRFIYECVLKWGHPNSWMVYFMEIPHKKMMLGYPYDLGNLHTYVYIYIIYSIIYSKSLIIDTHITTISSMSMSLHPLFQPTSLRRGCAAGSRAPSSAKATSPVSLAGDFMAIYLVPNGMMWLKQS